MFHVYCNHDHVFTADTVKMALEFIENDRTSNDWYVIKTGHGLTVLDETKGIDNVNDYFEDDGGLSQEQIAEFTAKGAECFTTVSDVGSVKVGIEGKCTICIPNGYGDGDTTVVVAKKLLPDIPYIGTFVTSVEGNQIGIFASDCGDTVVRTISGRYGIYNIPGKRCVVFDKWED